MHGEHSPADLPNLIRKARQLLSANEFQDNQVSELLDFLDNNCGAYGKVVLSAAKFFATEGCDIDAQFDDLSVVSQLMPASVGADTFSIFIDIEKFKVWPRNLEVELGTSICFQSLQSAKVVKPFLEVVSEPNGTVVFSAAKLGGGTDCLCTLDHVGKFAFRSEVYPFLSGFIDVTEPKPGLKAMTEAPDVFLHNVAVTNAEGSLQTAVVAPDRKVELSNSDQHSGTELQTSASAGSSKIGSYNSTEQDDATAVNDMHISTLDKSAKIFNDSRDSCTAKDDSNRLQCTDSHSTDEVTKHVPLIQEPVDAIAEVHGSHTAAHATEDSTQTQDSTGCNRDVKEGSTEKKQPQSGTKDGTVDIERQNDCQHDIISSASTIHGGATHAEVSPHDDPAVQKDGDNNQATVNKASVGTTEQAVDVPPEIDEHDTPNEDSSNAIASAAATAHEGDVATQMNMYGKLLFAPRNKDIDEYDAGKIPAGAAHTLHEASEWSQQLAAEVNAQARSRRSKASSTSRSSVTGQDEGSDVQPEENNVTQPMQGSDHEEDEDDDMDYASDPMHGIQYSRLEDIEEYEMQELTGAARVSHDDQDMLGSSGGQLRGDVSRLLYGAGLRPEDAGDMEAGLGAGFESRFHSGSRGMGAYGRMADRSHVSEYDPYSGYMLDAAGRDYRDTGLGYNRAEPSNTQQPHSIARSGLGRRDERRSGAKAGVRGHQDLYWPTCAQLVEECQKDGAGWMWTYSYVGGLPPHCDRPMSEPRPEDLLVFNRSSDWKHLPNVVLGQACDTCQKKYHSPLNAHRCQQRHQAESGGSGGGAKTGAKPGKAGGKLASKKSTSVQSAGDASTASRVQDMAVYWNRLVQEQPASAAAVLALAPLGHDVTWPTGDHAKHFGSCWEAVHKPAEASSSDLAEAASKPAEGTTPSTPASFFSAACNKLLDLICNSMLLGHSKQHIPDRGPSHVSRRVSKSYWTRSYGLAKYIKYLMRGHYGSLAPAALPGAAAEGAAAADSTIHSSQLPTWEDLQLVLTAASEGHFFAYKLAHPEQVLDEWTVDHLNKLLTLGDVTRTKVADTHLHDPDAMLALLLELSLNAALDKERARADALSQSLLEELVDAPASAVSGSASGPAGVAVAASGNAGAGKGKKPPAGNAPGHAKVKGGRGSSKEPGLQTRKSSKSSCSGSGDDEAGDGGAAGVKKADADAAASAASATATESQAAAAGVAAVEPSSKSMTASSVEKQRIGEDMAGPDSAPRSASSSQSGAASATSAQASGAGAMDRNKSHTQHEDDDKDFITVLPRGGYASAYGRGRGRGSIDSMSGPGGRGSGPFGHAPPPPPPGRGGQRSQHANATYQSMPSTTPGTGAFIPAIAGRGYGNVPGGPGQQPQQCQPGRGRGRGPMSSHTSQESLDSVSGQGPPQSISSATPQSQAAGVRPQSRNSGAGQPQLQATSQTSVNAVQRPGSAHSQTGAPMAHGMQARPAPQAVPVSLGSTTAVPMQAGRAQAPSQHVANMSNPASRGQQSYPTQHQAPPVAGPKDQQPVVMTQQYAAKPGAAREALPKETQDALDFMSMAAKMVAAHTPGAPAVGANMAAGASAAGGRAVYPAAAPDMNARNASQGQVAMNRSGPAANGNVANRTISVDAKDAAKAAATAASAGLVTRTSNPNAQGMPYATPSQQIVAAARSAEHAQHDAQQGAVPYGASTSSASSASQHMGPHVMSMNLQRLSSTGSAGTGVSGMSRRKSLDGTSGNAAGGAVASVGRSSLVLQQHVQQPGHASAGSNPSSGPLHGQGAAQHTLHMHNSPPSASQVIIQPGQVPPYAVHAVQMQNGQVVHYMHVVNEQGVPAMVPVHMAPGAGPAHHMPGGVAPAGAMPHAVQQHPAHAAPGEQHAASHVTNTAAPHSSPVPGAPATAQHHSHHHQHPHTVPGSGPHRTVSGHIASMVEASGAAQQPIHQQAMLQPVQTPAGVVMMPVMMPAQQPGQAIAHMPGQVMATPPTSGGLPQAAHGQQLVAMAVPLPGGGTGVQYFAVPSNSAHPVAGQAAAAHAMAVPSPGGVALMPQVHPSTAGAGPQMHPQPQLMMPAGVPAGAVPVMSPAPTSATAQAAGQHVIAGSANSAGPYAMPKPDPNHPTAIGNIGVAGHARGIPQTQGPHAINVPAAGKMTPSQVPPVPGRSSSSSQAAPTNAGSGVHTTSLSKQDARVDSAGLHDHYEDDHPSHHEHHAGSWKGSGMHGSHGPQHGRGAGRGPYGRGGPAPHAHDALPAHSSPKPAGSQGTSRDIETPAGGQSVASVSASGASMHRPAGIQINPVLAAQHVSGVASGESSHQASPASSYGVRGPRGDRSYGEAGSRHGSQPPATPSSSGTTATPPPGSRSGRVGAPSATPSQPHLAAPSQAVPNNAGKPAVDVAAAANKIPTAAVQGGGGPGHQPGSNVASASPSLAALAIAQQGYAASHPSSSYHHKSHIHSTAVPAMQVPPPSATGQHAASPLVSYGSGSQSMSSAVPTTVHQAHATHHAAGPAAAATHVATPSQSAAAGAMPHAHVAAVVPGGAAGDQVQQSVAASMGDKSVAAYMLANPTAMALQNNLIHLQQQISAGTITAQAAMQMSVQYSLQFQQIQHQQQALMQMQMMQQQVQAAAAQQAQAGNSAGGNNSGGGGVDKSHPAVKPAPGTVAVPVLPVASVPGAHLPVITGGMPAMTGIPHHTVPAVLAAPGMAAPAAAAIPLPVVSPAVPAGNARYSKRNADSAGSYGAAAPVQYQGPHHAATPGYNRTAAVAGRAEPVAAAPTQAVQSVVPHANYDLPSDLPGEVGYMQLHEPTTIVKTPSVTVVAPAASAVAQTFKERVHNLIKSDGTTATAGNTAGRPEKGRSQTGGSSNSASASHAHHGRSATPGDQQTTGRTSSTGSAMKQGEAAHAGVGRTSTESAPPGALQQAAMAAAAARRSSSGGGVAAAASAQQQALASQRSAQAAQPERTLSAMGNAPAPAQQHRSSSSGGSAIVLPASLGPGTTASVTLNPLVQTLPGVAAAAPGGLPFGGGGVGAGLMGMLATAFQKKAEAVAAQPQPPYHHHHQELAPQPHRQRQPRTFQADRAAQELNARWEEAMAELED